MIQEAQMATSSDLNDHHDADRARLHIKPDPDIPVGSGMRMMVMMMIWS